MGYCNHAMTCKIGCLCPHQHCAKVIELHSFLLAGCLALLHGRGGRWHWCCSQCVVGCGSRRSQSSGLLPLLLCPCSGRRHHGGVGRGHYDDLNLVTSRLCNVRRWQQQDSRSCKGSTVILLQIVHQWLKEGHVSAQEGGE
jgi:hypothetical protein